MKVKLLAYTKMDPRVIAQTMEDTGMFVPIDQERQAVALTAIRSCYHPVGPSSVLSVEGPKYLGEDASEAKRLIKHIMDSGHTSTFEHISYTFTVEGVSRSLLAQLTRHRIGTGFSVQSQRYVKLETGSKADGFDYIVPPSIQNSKESMQLSEITPPVTPESVFKKLMDDIQKAYDQLRAFGIPAEDARYVLPNACETKLTFSINLRALLHLHNLRGEGTHAQWEIQELAETLRKEVEHVDPWTRELFSSKS